MTQKHLLISMFLSVFIHVIFLLTCSLIMFQSPLAFKVSFTEVTVIGVSSLGKGLGSRAHIDVKSVKTSDSIRTVKKPHKNEKSESGIIAAKKPAKTIDDIIAVRKSIPIGVEDSGLPEIQKNGMTGFGNDTGPVGAPWGNPKFVGTIAQRGIKTKILPIYPEWAKKKGIEGEVLVGIYVTPSGKVMEKVDVIRKSGYKELDDSAVEAVKKWVFEPLPDNVKQKIQYGYIPFKFELKK